MCTIRSKLIDFFEFDIFDLSIYICVRFQMLGTSVLGSGVKYNLIFTIIYILIYIESRILLKELYLFYLVFI